jgi:hypothetical protein
MESRPATPRIVYAGRILIVLAIIITIWGAGSQVTSASNHLSTPDSSKRSDPLKLPLAQGGECDGTDGIYLYEDSNYEGRCSKFTDDQASLNVVGFNDIASSIQFVGSYGGGRYQVTLCEHVDYDGDCSPFVADDENFGDDKIDHDRASSLAIVPVGQCDGSDGIYLYEHSNYEGHCWKFTDDQANLKKVIFNDIASSVRFVGNYSGGQYQITLCEHADYGGDCSHFFSKNDENFADEHIGHDRASSLRIEKIDSSRKIIRVIIDSLRATSILDDDGTEADFYAFVKISGEEFQSEIVPDNDNISPHWEFSKQVSRSRALIPIVISIFDKDGTSRLADKLIDINPVPRQTQDLVVDLNSCDIWGHQGGWFGNQPPCTAKMASVGREENNNAEIFYRVVVENSSPASNIDITTFRHVTQPVVHDFSVQIDVPGNETLETVKLLLDDTSIPGSSKQLSDSSRYAGGDTEVILFQRPESKCIAKVTQEAKDDFTRYTFHFDLPLWQVGTNWLEVVAETSDGNTSRDYSQSASYYFELPVGNLGIEDGGTLFELQNISGFPNIPIWASKCPFAFCKDADQDGLLDLWENIAIEVLRPVLQFDEDEEFFENKQHELAIFSRVFPASADQDYILFHHFALYSEDYGNDPLAGHNGDNEDFQVAWRIQSDYAITLEHLWTEVHWEHCLLCLPERQDKDYGLDHMRFTPEGFLRLAIEEDKHGTWPNPKKCNDDSAYDCDVRSDKELRPRAVNIGEPPGGSGRAFLDYWLAIEAFDPSSKVLGIFAESCNPTDPWQEAVWNDPGDGKFCGGDCFEENLWASSPDSIGKKIRENGDFRKPHVYPFTFIADNNREIITLNPKLTCPGISVVTSVNPTSGGSLTYTDPQGNETRIVIPPGAVSEELTLVYTSRQKPSSTPSDFSFAGHAFSLEAFRNGQLLPGFVFNEPVTVTINYSDDDVAGLVERMLTLNYWDPAASSWEDAVSTCEPASDYDRQLDENRLSLPICHLTEFALFGKKRHDTYLPMIYKNYRFGPDLVVDRLIATNEAVTVTIRNAGDAPVRDDTAHEFWVDLYVNPSHKPGYNETCQTMECQGAAWGITWSGSPYSPSDPAVRALPLEPGEVFTLTTRSDYYWWPKEGIEWPLEPGDRVYAQVDSANTETSYGGVQESNENNNVSEGVSVQSLGPVSPSASSRGTEQDMDMSKTGLPPRP